MKYHKTTGNNQQTIKVGKVVLVHDDGNRTNCMVISKLLTGNCKDGITRAAKIRTAQGKTNRATVKLAIYPL